MAEIGKSRVGYVFSRELLRQADRIPCVRNRASMVHSLIESYGLLKLMTLIPAESASIDQLRAFHSLEYVQALEECGRECDSDEEVDSELEEFGLGFDCPPLPGMLSLACELAGASLTAADALCRGTCRVAINWCGGWHHAQRDAAHGFCYVNDIVLAITRLLTRFDRVMYVDLDVHHGDGVQHAFYHSSRVLTVSVHHCGPGFFPNSGSWEECGVGRGRLHTVNIPLAEGASDTSLLRVVDAVSRWLTPVFQPHVLVVQCGADCLAADPAGAFSATAAGLARCVRTVTRGHLPVLVLGGGGYHAGNAARSWTLVTAALRGVSLHPDVPDHHFFTEYGPSFELNTDAGTRRDLNTHQCLLELEERIQQRAEQLQQMTGYSSSSTR